MNDSLDRISNIDGILITPRYEQLCVAHVWYELTREIYKVHISMCEWLTLKCLHPLGWRVFFMLGYALHTTERSRYTRETNIVCA